MKENDASKKEESDYVFGSIKKINLDVNDEFMTSAVMQAMEQNKEVY